jgi:hypothetical protein
MKNHGDGELGGSQFGKPPVRTARFSKMAPSTSGKFWTQNKRTLQALSQERKIGLSIQNYLRDDVTDVFLAPKS